MPHVLTENRGDVAVVTLNDPDKRNAVNLEMNRELCEVFDRLEASPTVGAVVVTGTPPAFCAGADLDDLLASGQPDTMRDIYGGFLRVASSPLPTVAAVNGAAVGAGMNMALACDVIIAASSARFDCRFLQIGIHPGGGHTWRLRRITDHQTTMAMVVFGQTLSGEQAAAHGVAWAVVADEELVPHAVGLAERAASFPRELTRRTKATIVGLDRILDSDDAVDLEIEPQVWSMGEPEFQTLVAKLQARIGGPDGGG